MKAILLKPTNNKRLKCKHHHNGSETVKIEAMLGACGYAVCDIGWCSNCNQRVMKIGDGTPWKVLDASVVED